MLHASVTLRIKALPYAFVATNFHFLLLTSHLSPLTTHFPFRLPRLTSCIFRLISHSLESAIASLLAGCCLSLFLILLDLHFPFTPSCPLLNR